MKMKINNEQMNLIELNIFELELFNVGHKGTAYEVGVAVGEALKVAGTLAGLVVIFFMPKS